MPAETDTRYEHRRLSFIQTVCHHTAQAFYPLAWAGNPHRQGFHSSPSPVYMNLQLPGCTATMSPSRWWALTPPSHPYPRAGAVLFFCISPAVADCFYIRKWDALCCPDFPLAFSILSKPQPTHQRQTVRLPSQFAKVRLSERKTKYIWIFPSTSTFGIANGTMKRAENQMLNKQRF